MTLSETVGEEIISVAICGGSFHSLPGLISCWEDNVSGEKPEASFLHSTKSWSRIPLPDTILGTGMKVHAYTRSKHMISDFLHGSGLCVDYSRILSIETHLSQAIIENMKKTGGVLVPPDDQNKYLNMQICREKVEVKTLTKTAELREGRSLMFGSDINIEDVISVHEFSCIPRPLFAGSMLPYMDKSKLFSILRALYKEPDQNAQDQEDGSVLIIGACPRARSNESFKTCLELSAAFVASMTKSISRYITVHLVCDQYNTTTSLKQTARERHKSSTGRTSYM